MADNLHFNASIFPVDDRHMVYEIAERLVHIRIGNVVERRQTVRERID
ncbi:hypothetical protein CFBP4996_18335 [Agrobacterium leguminum]|uniref:Uncharacterized protein n=1 Tax=Agrobacterium leguminum TaxID=2792015 RepID=A0A9X3KDW3_9HYPH|nr:MULTISPECIES: hypothetical protein [Agrobacterium]MCZ7909346.1 hypothetical protein [Agrobacterium leguminum]WFS67981.1 hypothetical protein CFBP4996_18335 [Agrobacterium leguminum]